MQLIEKHRRNRQQRGVADLRQIGFVHDFLPWNFCHQLYPSQTPGITRSVPDMQIAYTVIAHELVLATRNVRDFFGCGVQVVNPFDGV